MSLLGSFAGHALRLRVLLLSAALAASTARAAPPLGSVPGTVIAVSSNSSTVFLGSPSLAIMPGGVYAASYDVGGKNPRAGHTAICASNDRGSTWTQLAELAGQHWSTLFLHRDALWLLGVSTKTGHSPDHQRNVIALTSSADLRDWREHYRLLRYAEGSVVVKAGSRVGFQYLDWQFDGDDIIAAARTSWDGLNYHDANYITFHRLTHFRTLTLADSPPDLAASPARYFHR